MVRLLNRIPYLWQDTSITSPAHLQFQRLSCHLQDADELFDAFKCVEMLLIQRRSQMAAWASLSAVANATEAPSSEQVGDASIAPPSAAPSLNQQKRLIPVGDLCRRIMP